MLTINFPQYYTFQDRELLLTGIFLTILLLGCTQRLFHSLSKSRRKGLVSEVTNPLILTFETSQGLKARASRYRVGPLCSKPFLYGSINFQENIPKQTTSSRKGSSVAGLSRISPNDR